MSTKWWEGYPWRNIQTNLRQIDMADINAEEYAESIKDMDATVAMINFGGIIASYHTALEDQTESDYLTGDDLGKIIAACHKKGIRVIARMDFSKIRKPVYDRHPDWAYRDINGNIVNYNGDVHACINGGYQQEYVYRIIDEILDKFDIDGIFFNMGGFTDTDYSYNYYGPCHCENCKREFMRMFGRKIPARKDMDDPDWRKYLLFKETIVEREKKRMADYIHSRNENIAVDLFDIGRCESNTEYKRPLPYFQYSASSNTRMLKGISKKIIPTNTTVDFIGYFYRHVSVSAAQHKLRLYQAMANRGGLDYYLIGRLDNHRDRTAYKPVKEVFSVHKANEDLFSSCLESMAEVLLLKTRFWDIIAEERGWVRFLSENHIPFDEAFESDLLDSDISRYSTIIIPEILKLSGQAIAKLTAFARNGGTVIVVGESGKYDGEYDEAENPFGELLGITSSPFVRTDMLSSMFIKKPEEAGIFKSMEDTDVIMLGDKYIYCRYSGNVEKYMRLIPPHKYGPPERCYYTEVTDHPCLTVNRIGKGKGIFLPWQPGTLYYREGYDNTLFIISDILKVIAGIASVSESASPMVEITYSREKEDRFFLVQMVNTSGHYGTSYFDALKIGDIDISIECSRKISKARTVIAGSELPFRQTGSSVSFTVPLLKDYECIVLE
ncbi:MAG: beta-galactosidase trimerization domain-containing protein [Candidatus Ornithospirochaeta sp.]|nr:beta-galactosidase trimerization domain-containing protein [Candidatus Ornithospirochaeta sp.]